MRKIISVLVLTAIFSTGCVEERNTVEGEFEVLCGQNGFYTVTMHQENTAYTNYARGYCPPGTVCVSGFGPGGPCED